MFERSQGKHNSLGSYDFLGNIFPLIAKYFYQWAPFILKIGEDFSNDG
jgi:hypothetical protein